MAASNEHETTVFSVKVPTLVKVEDDWGNNHNAPVPIDRGDGDGVTIEEIEEIGALGEIVEPRNDTKVTIEDADSSNAPVLPLTKLSEEEFASSSIADKEGQREFSEDKDAPETSHPVYEFNMTKIKTLPRQLNLQQAGVFRICSSQTQAVALGLLGTSLLVCLIIIIMYWATS